MAQKPWAVGFIVGVLAYVFGVAMAAILVMVEDNPQWQVDGVAEGVSMVDVYAWVFYDSHFVGVTTHEVTRLDAQQVHILQEFPPDLPVAAFYLVPVIVLIGGGFVVAYSQSRSVLPASNAIVGGMTVTTGYLLLAGVGTYVFTAESSSLLGTVTVAPHLGYATLLMGLVYPVVLGGIGGLLASLVKR